MYCKLREASVTAADVCALFLSAAEKGSGSVSDDNLTQWICPLIAVSQRGQPRDRVVRDLIQLLK